MISVVIPDMPSSGQLLPWLSAMNQRRWYTNFGPLVREIEKKLLDLVPCSFVEGARVLAAASGP